MLHRSLLSIHFTSSCRRSLLLECLTRVQDWLQEKTSTTSQTLTSPSNQWAPTRSTLNTSPRACQLSSATVPKTRLSLMKFKLRRRKEPLTNGCKRTWTNNSLTQDLNVPTHRSPSNKVLSRAKTTRGKLISFKTGKTWTRILTSTLSTTRWLI